MIEDNRWIDRNRIQVLYRITMGRREEEANLSAGPYASSIAVEMVRVYISICVRETVMRQYMMVEPNIMVP